MMRSRMRERSSTRHYRKAMGSWGERPRRVAPSGLREKGVRLFVCVIRAPHERTGFDVSEAQAEGDALDVQEFLRRVVPRHGEVGQGRPQILADGEDLAVHVAQVS